MSEKEQVTTPMPFDPRTPCRKTKDYYAADLDGEMITWADDSKNAFLPTFFAETARLQAIVNKKHGTASQSFPTIMAWYFLRAGLNNERNAPFIKGGMSYYQDRGYYWCGLCAMRFEVNAQKFVDFVLRTIGAREIRKQDRLTALTSKNGILHNLMQHGLLYMSEITSDSKKTVTVTLPSLIDYVEKCILADLEPNSKEKRSILQGIKYLRNGPTKVTALFPGLWKLYHYKGIDGARSKINGAVRSALVQLYAAKCNGGMDFNPQWNKSEELKIALSRNDFRRVVALLNEQPNYHNTPKAGATLASDLNMSHRTLTRILRNEDVKICKIIPVFKVIATNANASDVMKARASICKYVTEDYYDTGPLRVCMTGQDRKTNFKSTDRNDQKDPRRYNLYIQRPNTYLLENKYPMFFCRPEAVPTFWYDKTQEEASKETEAFQRRIDKCTGVRPVVAWDDECKRSLVKTDNDREFGEYEDEELYESLETIRHAVKYAEDLPVTQPLNRKQHVDAMPLADWTPAPYSEEYILNSNFSTEKREKDEEARKALLQEQEKEGKERIKELEKVEPENLWTKEADNINKRIAKLERKLEKATSTSEAQDILDKLAEADCLKITAQEFADAPPTAKKSPTEELLHAKRKQQNRYLEREEAKTDAIDREVFGVGKQGHFRQFTIPQKAIDTFEGDKKKANLALRTLEHKLYLAREQDKDKTAKKLIKELEELGSCDPRRRYNQYYDGDKIIGIYLNHYEPVNNTSFAEYVLRNVSPSLNMSFGLTFASVHKNEDCYFPVVRGSTRRYATKRATFNTRSTWEIENFGGSKERHEEDIVPLYGNTREGRVPLPYYFSSLKRTEGIGLPSKKKLEDSWKKTSANTS